MIRYYALDGHGLRGNEVTAAAVLPHETLWIDLLEPTVEEELKVERDLGIDVPTREEMREIETSNRLYEEGDALYMTATVVTKLDTDRPTSDQITFILTPDRLITNRYVDPLPFRRYVAYAEKHSAQCNTAPAILAGLLESIVNRIADVLERIGTDMDALSNEVFASNGNGLHRSRDFRLVLERVGRNGDLVSKARETLASLGRLVVFLQQTTHPQIQNDARNRLRTLGRDIAQMSDHATFIGNKVQFMLDATLGMINIDQNNILKIFSVVTLIMLPPSVIGGIFGMNFAVIPLSQHPLGFELALGLMVLSAVTPFVMFKRRGWL
jgi:magnesium transporter